MAKLSGTILTWKNCLEPCLPSNTVWNHIVLNALSGTIFTWQHCLVPYWPGSTVWNHVYLATLSGTILTWTHCQEPYLPGNTVWYHIDLDALSGTMFTWQHCLKHMYLDSCVLKFHFVGQINHHILSPRLPVLISLLRFLKSKQRNKMVYRIEWVDVFN